MRYFDSEPTGRLISRITHDSEVIRQMYVSVLPVMFRALLRVVGIFIAMALLNLKLMLVTLLVIPLLLLSIKIYHRISQSGYPRHAPGAGQYQCFINESLLGMRIIQATNQEQAQQGHFNENNEEWSRLKREDHQHRQLATDAVYNLVNALILAVLVGWFGYQAGYTVVEVGTLYAFINYLGRFFDPFRQIAVQMSSLQQALVASERVFELLDQPRRTVHDYRLPIAQLHQITQGKVEFRQGIALLRRQA